MNKALLLLFGFLNLQVQGQDCPEEMAMKSQGLQAVRAKYPQVLEELRYASTNNFMQKKVYGCLNKAYVQAPVLEKLGKSLAYLEKHHPGLRFLIYDAARPLSIQWKLWNTLAHLPERERAKYVANPKEHSIHNYGSALDLTLADAQGLALDMGTSYDFFGPLAYPSQESYFLASGKLSNQAYKNRLILREAMKAGGFSPIDFEWWHFNAYARKVAKQKFKVIQ